VDNKVSCNPIDRVFRIEVVVSITVFFGGYDDLLPFTGTGLWRGISILLRVVSLIRVHGVGLKILPKSENPYGLWCWARSRSGTVVETTASNLETR
jgi:hypothetical protein